MGRKFMANWNIPASLQKVQNTTGIYELLSSPGLSNRELFPTIYMLSCWPCFYKISLSFLSGWHWTTRIWCCETLRAHYLLWNFKVADKVWVLNDNYCVEVQHYWQHNVLEATVIQNSQCLLLWNILVPRYYCITMVPCPTAHLPIKQLLYIPLYMHEPLWSTSEHLLLPAQSLQDSASSYPASKQKQSQRRC